MTISRGSPKTGYEAPAPTLAALYPEAMLNRSKMCIDPLDRLGQTRRRRWHGEDVILFAFDLLTRPRNGIPASGKTRHFREVAISICRHAIPAHIRSEVRNFALRGLVAMMVPRFCGGDAPMMTIRMKVAGLIMATHSLCHNRISCCNSSRGNTVRVQS
jgi:hypothetical protein